MSSSISVGKYTNISVRMSFKVDPSKSRKIDVNMITNINEYLHAWVWVQVQWT